jgi:hypothetical protein
MAEGLLQMLGSGQQAQQQQQGNLLGGLFQSESQARRQGRERLLGQALQIAQQQDPIGTGFAVAGGLLGEGIGRAMGKVTPEEARQQKFAGLQTQLMQEGLDPTQNPFGFYARAAELLREQGDNQMSLRAAAMAREVAPDQEEIDRSVVDNTLPILLDTYNQTVSSNLNLSEQDSALSQIDFQLSQLPNTPRTEELKERVSSRLQSLRSKEKSVIVTPGTPQFAEIQGELSQYGSSLPIDQGAIEIKYDEAGRPSSFETDSGAVEVNTPSPALERNRKKTVDTRDRLSEKRDLLLESARIASDIYSDSSSATLGAVGFVSRIGDGIIQQASAAASEFDLNIDPSSYNFGDFKDNAIKSVQTRSAITAYAFSIAKADNEGRVTEADVQKAIDQIAGASGSMSQVKAGIATRLGNSIKGFDDVVLARQSDFEEIQGLSAPTSVSQFMRNNPERYNPELLQNLGVLNSSNAQGTDQAGANNQDTVLRYNPETETVE